MELAPTMESITNIEALIKELPIGSVLHIPYQEKILTITCRQGKGFIYYCVDNLYGMPRYRYPYFFARAIKCHMVKE